MSKAFMPSAIKYFFIVCILLFTRNIFSQDASGGNTPPPRFARNAIYVEALGNGLSVTLNYERMINEHWSIRAGAGFYLVDTGETTSYRSFAIPIVPVMVHYAYLFNPDNKFEFGAGVALQLSTVAAEWALPPISTTAVKFTMLAGYCYKPHSGGIVFRAGFTPVWYGGGFYPGAGMSLGWAF